VKASSFTIVANGFADGPAQALRDHLCARGALVHTVWHPLTAEDGTSHVIETWEADALAATRTVRTPLRPPTSYAVDPLLPVRMPPVDVWFGFNPSACARGLLDRRLRRARRVVLWSVDFVPDRFGRRTLQTRIYDRLDKLCCTRADARVELTEIAVLARNRRHGLPPNGSVVHVVPMGAWLDRVPTVSPEAWQRRRVVLLAHLVHRQGADLLLDALALLHDADVSADVIGTGPLEQSLRHRAKELGLQDAVTFHGFVADHREVERILAHGSLGVAPYRPGEGTFTTHADPGKLKSYVAAGLPAVLTDVPPNAHELAAEGVAEIIAFDAHALADAIRHLLDSPVEWQRRSTAALAYSKRFDWPVLLDGLMAELGLEVSSRRRVP
jgi:glycosyltransferase involved in cell wall biosynthesis